jgi:bifunctional non-homologous end joining protein LigD
MPVGSLYAGRTRSGFTPSSRDRLFKHYALLASDECPFANLPEARAGRWGEGLTAEKMKESHYAESGTMPNRNATA